MQLVGIENADRSMDYKEVKETLHAFVQVQTCNLTTLVDQSARRKIPYVSEGLK